MTCILRVEGDVVVTLHVPGKTWAEIADADRAGRVTWDGNESLIERARSLRPYVAACRSSAQLQSLCNELNYGGINAAMTVADAPPALPAYPPEVVA
jgi:hypothetical protein